MKNISRKYGFTLIELVVVVIMIAVLAAVAVPQYKKAVLKSRFSTVMPIAKNIVDAQEVYYLGKGYYAQDDEKDVLDVTPVTAENTTVTLSQTDGYDYVMAQTSKVPGTHYIMYQKLSQNYPGEIHCEAENENTDAQWLCGSLSQNNSIGQTISEGYTTYLIDGTGVGIVPGADDNTLSCASAEAVGLTCSITTNAQGKQVKQICTNGVCRTKTYEEDGGYTSVTCEANADKVCTANMKSVTYDSNGNEISKQYCNKVADDGTCSLYSSVYDFIYDANGNQTSQRYCRGSDIANDGTCRAYTGGTNSTYDANGNETSQRYCRSVAGDGTCSSYSMVSDYIYDVNGNQTSQRYCDSDIASDGTCRAYSSGADFTYDGNGNKLTSRMCWSVASDGTCSSYDDGRTENTYDENGNMISQRTCVVASDGTCSSYAAPSEYTYDENGNRISARSCSRVASDGACLEYSSNRIDTYDDDGKKITSQYCSGSNINTVTGECTAYNSTSVEVG